MGYSFDLGSLIFNNLGNNNDAFKNKAPSPPPSGMIKLTPLACSSPPEPTPTPTPSLQTAPHPCPKRKPAASPKSSCRELKAATAWNTGRV
jgi:hypothetical protein